MKKIELLMLNRTLLSLMAKNDIKAKDVNMIDLYLDAKQMESENLQKSYIVQVLADKYDMSVRKVYSMLDQLNTEITISV